MKNFNLVVIIDEMFPVHMIIEAALGRKFVGKEVSKGGPSAVISRPCQRLHEIFRRCQDLKREITLIASFSKQ